MYRRAFLSMRNSSFFALALAVLALLIAGAFIASSSAFVSHEVSFSDSSRGGLAIVPASCDSEPPERHTDAGECSASACNITATESVVQSGENVTLNWSASRTGDWGLWMAQPDRIRLTGSITPGGPSYDQRREQTGSATVRAPVTSSTLKMGYTFSGRTFYWWPALGGELAAKPFECTTEITVQPYACTGTVPPGAVRCAGDEQGLKVDTPWQLADRCTPAQKCEYTEEDFSCTGTVPNRAVRCSGDEQGLKVDTPWQLAEQCTPAQKCEYTQEDFKCTGTVPIGAVRCSGDEQGLTANTPWQLAERCTAARKCEYTQRTATCVGNKNIDHAILCTGDEDDVENDTSYALVTVCTLRKCELECEAGWHKDGDICVSDAASCYGPPYPSPLSSRLCPGDGSGVTVNTQNTLGPACSPPPGSVPKCQYICVYPYVYDSSSQSCIPGGGRSDIKMYIEVAPSLVRENEKTNVRWSFSAMQRCEIRGSNGQGWGPFVMVDEPITHATTSELSLAIVRATTYTMSCADVSGKEYEKNATVNLIPEWIEQ